MSPTTMHLHPRISLPRVPGLSSPSRRSSSIFFPLHCLHLGSLHVAYEISLLHSNTLGVGSHQPPMSSSLSRRHAATRSSRLTTITTLPPRRSNASPRSRVMPSLQTHQHRTATALKLTSLPAISPAATRSGACLTSMARAASGVSFTSRCVSPLVPVACARHGPNKHPVAGIQSRG